MCTYVNGWWKRCENRNMIWQCLDATFDFIWCLSQQTIDSILIFVLIFIFIRLCLFVGELCVSVCVSVVLCKHTFFDMFACGWILGACISVAHIFLLIWMTFIECAPNCAHSLWTYITPKPHDVELSSMCMFLPDFMFAVENNTCQDEKSHNDAVQNQLKSKLLTNMPALKWYYSICGVCSKPIDVYVRL